MGAASTGHAPPPRPPDLNWPSALRSAMLVAVVGAVLFGIATYIPALTIFSLLWILSAASVATGLYRHREPALRMNASIGARIGLSVGLLMNFLLSILLAIAGLIARFKTHSMASFDAEMTQRMHDQIERALATNPAPADVVRQMLSQEFRTGVMLAVFVLFALVILAFSTVGGVVSGMLAVGRDRAA